MLNRGRMRRYLGRRWRSLFPFGAGLYFFLMLIGLPANGGEPAYAVVDLGKYSEATAINDSGEVVGSIRVDGGDIHAFLYSNGRVHDLGTLGGMRSNAKGINAAGLVVGWSDTGGVTQGARSSGRAFIYAGGTMRAMELDKQTADVPGRADARDINSLGQIAIDVPGMRAAIWSSGVTQYLGTLVPKGAGYPLGKQMNPDGSSKELKSFGEGYTEACRINDSGAVVGFAASPDGHQHAFLFSNGTLRDLNMPGWKNSHAKDLNSRGQVVGSFNLEEGQLRAFFYSNGEMKDLGVPSGYKHSSANGINISGQIVGSAHNVSGGGFLWIGVESRAFLYEKGQWIDLSTRVNLAGSGLTELFDAERINARGQIIGKAMGPGAYHAYLLTPLRIESTSSETK